jgi:hypothetical protein
MLARFGELAPADEAADRPVTVPEASKAT